MRRIHPIRAPRRSPDGVLCARCRNAGEPYTHQAPAESSPPPDDSAPRSPFEPSSRPPDPKTSHFSPLHHTRNTNPSQTSSYTSLTPRQRHANGERVNWYIGNLVNWCVAYRDAFPDLPVDQSTNSHRAEAIMRLDRFTQRGQEAILAAQELAQTYNHNQIEPEHLLLALLQQPEGVVPEILQQAGANPASVQSQLEADLARRPKVYGGNAQPGLSGQTLARPAGCPGRGIGDARRLRQHRASAAGAARRQRRGRSQIAGAPAASRATACSPRSPRSAAANASPARTRKAPTRRWRNTAAI